MGFEGKANIFLNCGMVFIVLLLLVKIWAAFHLPFFWDACAASSQTAFYILDHGFRSWIFPPELVAEPPLVPGVLAGLWALVGPGLVSAHILFGSASLLAWWQLYVLLKRFVPAEHLPWVYALAISDPTWLAQSVQLSLDMFVVAFALTAVNAFWSQRRVLMSVALTALALTSVRGAIACAGLGLAVLVWSRSWRALLPFVIPALAFGAFLWTRKLALGYAVLHPDSMFAAHRKLLDMRGVMRNGAVLVFRLVDFGRIFVWGALAVLLLRYRLSALTFLRRSPLVLLAGVFLLVLLPFTIPLSNPFGHRYFLLTLVLGIAATGALLLDKAPPRAGRVGCLLLMAGLWTGNLWVYPDTVSQGWDASLAALPYARQRAQMLDYLDVQDIPVETVGSTFPGNGNLRDEFAGARAGQMAIPDSPAERYRLVARVQNELDTLEQSAAWTLQQDFSSGRLWMRLYKKN